MGLGVGALGVGKTLHDVHGLRFYHYWSILFIIFTGGRSDSVLQCKSWWPGDTSWKYLLFRNTHNIFQDLSGARSGMKFKVFILSFHPWLSLLDSFLNFQMKANKLSRWLHRRCLELGGPIFKISEIKFLCFKLVLLWFLEPLSLLCCTSVGQGIF
jgi:hypothetical protein